MSKPILAYLRAVRDLNLAVPDGDLHRTAQGEADREVEVALSEWEADRIAGEHYTEGEALPELAEGPGGIYWVGGER